MAKQYKYVYDLNSKKLIKKKLNEEDNNVTTDTTQQQTDQTTAQQQTVPKQSIESNQDYQKVQIEKQTRDKKYNDDIATQEKLLQVAQVNASKNTQNGPYDPVIVDPNVIAIQRKINDIKKQYAIDLHTIETKRLDLLTSLSKTNERWYYLPDKYKDLNESNINNAKVYVNSLVGNDDNRKILKNMYDFKRVFKNTDLLYGKDHNGYFVVAIDSEDLNKLSDTLEEEGYLRDNILDAIMPQILDRTSMIK